MGWQADEQDLRMWAELRRQAWADGLRHLGEFPPEWLVFCDLSETLADLVGDGAALCGMDEQDLAAASGIPADRIQAVAAGSTATLQETCSILAALAASDGWRDVDALVWQLDAESMAREPSADELDRQSWLDLVWHLAHRMTAAELADVLDRMWPLASPRIRERDLADELDVHRRELCERLRAASQDVPEGWPDDRSAIRFGYQVRRLLDGASVGGDE